MLRIIATGAILIGLTLHTMPAGAAPAAKDGWPATPAGEIGREWVAAFGGGDAAMRAFYQKRLSPASLEQSSADARLARYRPLRQRFGALTLGAVVNSKPDVLEVTLLDADAKPHPFTFTVEPGTPARLAKVTMTENRPGGHGGLGGLLERLHGK